MSEINDIMKNLAHFMAEYELTFVATAGPLNRIAISHYNGVGFDTIQFDEEINADDLLKRLNPPE